MIPYGQNKKKRYNFVDCHPKKFGKDVKNWWEVELGSVDKGRERQQAKKELLESLSEPQDLIFTRKEMGRYK